MNEDEKKAIDYFKNLDISFNTLLRIDQNGFENAINTLLNLIEKQQKEIEELNLDLEEMTKSNNHKKEYWVHKSILNSYVSKDKIKELREIDNIDLIQFKLKKILGE